MYIHLLGLELGGVRVKTEQKSLQSGKNDHKKATKPCSGNGISVRQLLIPPNRSDVKTGIRCVSVDICICICVYMYMYLYIYRP
jgi:hypothetical protein